MLKPSCGEVLGADSINLSDVSYKDLYAETSLTAQSFNRYPLSFSDNITIAANAVLDHEKIDKVIDSLSLRRKVDSLADGIETKLVKEFGGQELSGGELQTLALARSFYKDSKLYLLDEPTAALDAFKETSVLESIENFTENSGAVVITHRLALAPKFDCVIVLEDGKIIEKGSHSELMQKKGVYFEMFNYYKKQYSDEKVEI